MRKRSLLLLSDYNYRIPAPGAGKTSLHVMIGFWSSFSLVDQKMLRGFLPITKRINAKQMLRQSNLFFFFYIKTYNSLNRLMIYWVSLITSYFLFESLRYGCQPEKIMKESQNTEQLVLAPTCYSPKKQGKSVKSFKTSIITSVVGVSGLTASAFELNITT